MTDPRHARAPIAIAVLALMAGACRPVSEPAVLAPEPPPAAEPAPTPDATPIPVAAPSLELVQGEALVTSGGRPLAETPSTLAIGDAVEVAEGGLAVLRWEPGLRAELLAGSRARLEIGAADRTARLVHEAGVARFTVAAAAEGMALDVASGAVALRADQPADVVVGFDPDAEGATWVYVIDGDVALTRASAGSPAPGVDAGARLGAGHGVVFARDVEQPVALPIDLPGVEAWYASALAGTAPSIARASFRCAVRADAEPVRLLAHLPAPSVDGDEPSTDAPDDGADALDATVEPIAPRTLVEVAVRDATGRWLQVTVVPTGGLRPRAVGATVGWVSVDHLDCVGPIDGLVVGDPHAASEAPVADAAAQATMAPGPAAFAVDRTTLARGDCALITWDVPAGTAVTLDGRAVAGKGIERACPESAATYRLAWIDARGARQERAIQVQVVEAVAAAAAGDDGGRRDRSAAPEPTPCETECVIELPTLAPEPTRRPRPTATVRAQPSAPPPAPTAAPQPTAERPEPTRPAETPDPGPGDPTRPPDPSATPDPGATPSPTEPGVPTAPPEPATPSPTPEEPATPEPPATTPEPGTGTPTPTDPPTAEP